MKTTSLLANMDPLPALAPFDSATAATTNPTTMIRAEARLEQILASDPNGAQPTSAWATAPRRSARQVWGLRLAAIPVAAALIVAASVAWPGGEDTQPANLPVAQAALASWSALPSELPAAIQPAAEAACRADLNAGLQSMQWGSTLPDPPLPASAPVVSEARGNWGAVAFYDEGVQSGVCLLWLEHPEQPRIVFTVQTSFWNGQSGSGGPRLRQPVPIGVGPGLLPRVDNSMTFGSFTTSPIDVFEVDVITEATVVTEGPFTMVVGRATPEVTELAATFDNGRSIATISNGWFLAWLPGTITGIDTARGTSSETPWMNLDSLLITATLADGTLIERPAFDQSESEPIDPNRPTLGIGLSFGLPTVEVDGVPHQGVPVTKITPGSGGEAAGLQPGDIIIAIGGNPIVNMDTLSEYITEHSLQVGDVVTLTVVRDGAALDIELPLVAWGDLQLPE